MVHHLESQPGAILPVYATPGASLEPRRRRSTAAIQEVTDMCTLCENAATTEEEVAELHGRILKWGFTMVSVGSPQRRGWAYTIGLLDQKGHPELVVAGWPLPGAVRVLGEMAESVVAGRRYDVGGPEFSMRGTDLGVVCVHEEHLKRGLMNMWHTYYDGVGRFDLELRAMQIVLPDADHCFEHQRLQPRLDDPRHVFRYDGMGPAERRGHPGNRRVPPRPSTRRRRRR